MILILSVFADSKSLKSEGPPRPPVKVPKRNLPPPPPPPPPPKRTTPTPVPKHAPPPPIPRRGKK